MSKLDSAPSAFCFDDFQLAPVHSKVRSRKDPDVSVRLEGFRYNAPVIASPMNTICEAEMCRQMHMMGATGVLHRYMSIEDQVKQASELLVHGTIDSEGGIHDFWAAVGANGDAEERTAALAKVGVYRFCIDVANGHSDHCVEAVKRVRSKYPNALIMAGNVCTYDGALRLADAGANAIRVGIGPGSMCTTRLVTGHGIPQLSAIEDCARIKDSWWTGAYDNSKGSGGPREMTKTFPDVVLIADGGLRNSGDIVKALAIGADMVMLGSLLAGTEATPGEPLRDADGNQFKHYHGMASEQGRKQWFSRDRTAYVPEGASTTVPYRGSTIEVVSRLVGGLKVGMSYADAFDLEELRENAKWMRVTNAGHAEGTPHGK